MVNVLTTAVLLTLRCKQTATPPIQWLIVTPHWVDLPFKDKSIVDKLGDGATLKLLKIVRD